MCLVHDPRPSNSYGQLYTVQCLGNMTDGRITVYNNQPIDILMRVSILIWFNKDSSFENDKALRKFAFRVSGDEFISSCFIMDSSHCILLPNIKYFNLRTINNNVFYINILNVYAGCQEQHQGWRVSVVRLWGWQMFYWQTWNSRYWFVSIEITFKISNNLFLMKEEDFIDGNEEQNDNMALKNWRSYRL